MRLVEAEKAKDVIHEYFKSLMVNGASGADVDRLAVGIGSCLKHDANLLKAIDELPSVQPDIIRCKDCKHWNPQLKTANGNGLGSCDFHNVALVTSEGFCYWAERGEQNDSEAD
jgi:hypothetical protein